MPEVLLENVAGDVSGSLHQPLGAANMVQIHSCQLTLGARGQHDARFCKKRKPYL
jgi:hypothetical protein